jgi:Tfp pilus assembly protein PilN
VRAVNLLPRETRSSRSSRRVDPLLAGGAALTVVVAAAVGGGFFVAHSHAASEQNKLAAARTQLSRLQAEARQASTGHSTPVLPTPAVTLQQGPWQAALAGVLSARVAWDDVLSQVARVVPGNVTVSNLSLGGGTTSTTATAGTAATSPHGTLTLGGTAFSEDGVVQLLSRLALVPDLSNVALTSSTVDSTSGHVTFTLTAQVSTPSISQLALGSGASS